MLIEYILISAEYILISALILRRSLYFQTDIVLVIVITLSILYTSCQNKTNGPFFFLLANLRFVFFINQLSRSVKFHQLSKLLMIDYFGWLFKLLLDFLIVWAVLFALGASKILCISQHEATVDKKYGTFGPNFSLCILPFLNSHFFGVFSKIYQSIGVQL